MEKTAERSGIRGNFRIQFNNAVRLLSDDDCGVDATIYENGPIKEALPSHTLTIDEWEKKVEVQMRIEPVKV